MNSIDYPFQLVRARKYTSHLIIRNNVYIQTDNINKLITGVDDVKSDGDRRCASVMLNRAVLYENKMVDKIDFYENFDYETCQAIKFHLEAIGPSPLEKTISKIKMIFK